MAANDEHHDKIVDQFSQQAEGYARRNTLNAPQAQQALIELVRPKRDDRLLDVCCGPGALTLDLAPLVAHATGLDLTPAMLDQARAAQAKRGVDNNEWRVGDVCALPFADGAFSLVVCSAAFHHLEEPRVALTEMARVCKAGGRIAVRDVTPRPECAAAYDRIEKLRDPSHTHALTPDEMARLGDGLALTQPSLEPSIAADLPLGPILDTSFPETCTRDQIRDMIGDDARSGEDRLGFAAKEKDGALLVSYRLTTAVWTKTG